MTLKGLLFAAVLLAGSAASAATVGESDIIVPGRSARTEAPAPTVSSSLNRAALYLGVAMAAVGGFLVYRNRRNTPAGRELRSLAIDETRSLGNRQYLVVASYDGRKFLLGVCPGRIEMLTPLNAPASDARSAG